MPILAEAAPVGVRLLDRDGDRWERVRGGIRISLRAGNLTWPSSHFRIAEEAFGPFELEDDEAVESGPSDEEEA